MLSISYVLFGTSQPTQCKSYIMYDCKKNLCSGTEAGEDKRQRIGERKSEVTLAVTNGKLGFKLDR